MTQTIFRWLSPLVLLAVLLAAPAVAEEGQIYTVKKGDTLWDLSQRFIDDPYYWPNVWAHNPDITNPHLIFPGQKIRILDGRLEIIPAYPDAKNTPDGEADSASPMTEPQAQEVITFQSTGSGVGFILTSEKSLGTLVDSVDNRVLLTRSDMVFVKMKNLDNVAVGDIFSLFSRGAKIEHPQSGKLIGTMMNNLGTLQIKEISGQTVTAKIDQAFREITRGAELFKYIPERKDLVLSSAATPEIGYIIATRDEKYGQGANDIVFIDRGSDNGLTSGNFFYISRPRKASDEIIAQAGEIDLPDEVLGAAVVIDVNKKTSSALIIKSVDAMYVGDKVTLVSE